MNLTESVKETVPYHLYLGAKVQTPDGIGKLIVATTYGSVTVTVDSDKYFMHNEVKLILRKLSDMTEEEAIECAFPSDGPADVHFLHILPSQFKYLLSKGFDLFNLIERGLALDESTIKG